MVNPPPSFWTNTFTSSSITAITSLPSIFYLGQKIPVRRFEYSIYISTMFCIFYPDPHGLNPDADGS